MAGNPFRRPDGLESLPAIDVAPSGNRESGVRGMPRAFSTTYLLIDNIGKSKKVSFVSPLTSPQDAPQLSFPTIDDWESRSSEDPPHSPPPQGLVVREDELDTKALLRGDLTAGGTIDLREHDRQAGARTSAAQQPLAATGRSGPPVNPFARTLASIEPTEKAAATQEAAVIANNDPASRSMVGQGRGTMDVDAFKRLLLTGTAGVSQSTPQPPNGSESNMNMSSKRYNFQPPKDQHPGSGSASPDTVSSEDEEEGAVMRPDTGEPSQPVSADPPSLDARSQKPAVPTHTHGKRHETTGPQTVSFADFDDAFASSENFATMPPWASPLTRTFSDLNKPLPLPPTGSDLAAGTKFVEAPSVNADSVRSSVPGQYREEDAGKTKRAAPPPPTARRKAGPPTVRARNNSNRDLAKGSLDGADVVDQKPNAAPRPEPPPSRHAAPLPGGSAMLPSVSSQNGDQDSRAPLPAMHALTERHPPKSKAPPPPPARLSSRSTSQLTRTPSAQSSTSITNRRVSPSPNAPPLPPPRGSKRASYDGSSGAELRTPKADTRRFSGQSFESRSSRRDSVSSLQRVAEDQSPDTPKATRTADLPDRDMLADLDAFQREVDALRTQRSHDR